MVSGGTLVALRRRMSKKLFVAAALSMFAATGCIDTERAESDDSTELSSVESNVNIYPNYGGSHRIWNPYYHQHVIALGNFVNTALSLSSRTSDTRLSWTFTLVGDDVYRLKNNQTGFCADPWTTQLTHYVWQESCNSSSNFQKWHLEHGIDGYLLRNVGSNLCLDTAGNTDSSLMQYTCDYASGSQQWQIQ